MDTNFRVENLTVRVPPFTKCPISWNLMNSKNNKSVVSNTMAIYPITIKFEVGLGLYFFDE